MTSDKANQMRFQDPIDSHCEACGHQERIRVRDILALRATCSNCGGSFRQSGLRMRALIDDTVNFYDAVQIIMSIEENEGMKISDAVVEGIRPWEHLTIRDLITAAECSMAPTIDRRFRAERMVIAAIENVFPSAPKPFDYDAHLHEAISPDPDYEKGYP